MAINLLDSIIKYERGELNVEGTLELFGELVRSGQAWTLQGHYGRTASQLIEAGYLDSDGNVTAVVCDYVDADTSE